MVADLDGGALMDVGCYCVSGARLLAGEPERVFGEQVVGPTGVDVDFYGVMRFPNDVVAVFDASFTLPKRQRLEAVGEEATLVLEAPWRSDWGGRVLVDDEQVAVPAANPYELELTNFAAAIAGEGSAARTRRRGGTGARDRGALPLGGIRRGSPALMLPELAAELVAVDSVNPTLVPDGGGEAAVARVLAEWLERAGLEVEVEEVVAGRPNVIGVARGSGGGRTLILNGHLDTVGLLEPDGGFRRGSRAAGCSAAAPTT